MKGLVFDSIGTVIEVCGSDRNMLETIATLMGHFSKTDGPADQRFSIEERGDGFVVYTETQPLIERASRDQALMELLAAINEVTITRARYLAVHAGVVVSRNGEVIAFPAPQKAGKSTLVAACLLAGFSYGSDEALFIDTQTGRVVPYPKPLWLSIDSQAALGIARGNWVDTIGDRYKTPLLPAELGADAAEGELELTGVVLLERDGSPTKLERVDASDVAYQLLRHAFNRYERPQEWFHAVVRAARRATAWRLRYGDATDAALNLSRWEMRR